MATTTNYGWTTPDNTAYVKDGASAIRTLGSSVDTTLNSVTSGKNVGLVHINTTTFTSASIASASSVFNSTFDRYHITGNFVATSAPFFVIKLRDSGGDLTNNYLCNVSSQSNDNLHNNGVTANWQGSYYNTNTMSFSFDVVNPFLSVSSFAYGTTYYDNSTDYWGGKYSPTTSCTGISIMPNTGTFTGNIRIYGYRNS
jgi:hypothetical protein